MNSQDFDDFIADMLGRWMDGLTRKLKFAILTEQLVDTGTLYGSLKSKVLKNVAGMTATAQLEFRMYGRVLDLKKFRGILPNTNETNRAVTGVSNSRRRGSWYAKTYLTEKKTLTDTILNDVGKMSSKEFLKWLNQ